MGLSSRRAAAIPDNGVLALSTMDAIASGEPVAPPLVVERVAFKALPGFYEAWSDLCRRVLTKNIFLEPAFALPLLQHAARLDRPDVLLVWEESAPTSFGKLVGLVPIDSARSAISNAARTLHHPQVCLGAPLLDKDRAQAALDAACEWVTMQMPQVAALTFSLVPEDFADFLDRHWTARRLRSFERAALLRDSEAASGRVASARRRKEVSRQFRRLSEHGTVSYRTATEPAEIVRATEMFLALEHKGWKGVRGTTLLADPALATFTRSMTRLMGYEGKCRIDWLERDGQPVAMGIVLTADGVAHFWKTAFDERFAALSPGVQFTMALARRQAGDPSVTITDSCADPDHPMIDRVWRDRLRICDVMIAVSPPVGMRWARAVAVERAARALRDTLKRNAKRTGLLRLLRPGKARARATSA